MILSIVILDLNYEIFETFKQFKVLTVFRILSFDKSNFKLYALLLNAQNLFAYTIKYSKLLVALSSKIIAYFVVAAPLQNPEKRVP